MEATKIIGLVLVLISIITKPAYSTYYSQTTPYVSSQEKVTNLHFFFHDTLSGKNPSAVVVAHAKSVSYDVGDGAPPFGTVFALDDPLTVGPELNSEVVGHAQGLYVSSSKEELALVGYFDFGFSSGEFNGSSISLFSKNPVMETERELAVVGGRGKFRMARGFAHLKTYFVNQTTGDAIVEYNVTVVHY